MHHRPPTPRTPITLLLLASLTFGFTACGPKEATPPVVAAKPAPPVPPLESSPATAPVSPAPSVAPKPAPAPPAQVPAPAVASSTPSPSTPAPASPPAPTPEPKAPPSPSLPPAPPASPISDPGGEVAVKATKAGLTRVGASACKMCHKVQFTSWSESAHAKRTPALDCESCHGAGSEYKAIPVMKDSARARAAGLVQPTTAFCATCHKRNWNDSMLKRAHAHKA